MARTWFLWNFDARAAPSGARTPRQVESGIVKRAGPDGADLWVLARGPAPRLLAELLETYDMPVPGILTVRVIRPLLEAVTRNGPDPTLMLTPRLEAVTLTGPKLFDLR